MKLWWWWGEVRSRRNRGRRRAAAAAGGAGKERANNTELPHEVVASVFLIYSTVKCAPANSRITKVLFIKN